MSRAKASVSRGHLLDVSAQVAWRYRAYGGYGGDPRRALSAMRRRCPGFSVRQYENAFGKGLELYDAVERLVETCADDLWHKHNSGEESWARTFDSELRRFFPGFRLATFRSLVGMMFYYWHLR